MNSGPVLVRHYAPGGKEHGGGIGRFIGYVAAAEGSARHSVVDTRGPWLSLASPLRLLAAMMVMAGDRLSSPFCIHHIHVAGRGSTIRKLMLAAAARVLGCQHVLHLHDYDYAHDYASRSTIGRVVVKRMFQGADAVIVLGQHDCRLMTKVLGVRPERVVVFPNCAPDPGPAEAQVQVCPRIVFLGRLSERKGVPELLAALASPGMAVAPWKAVIAGDGDVARFRDLARSLGIGHRIEMPGWLDVDEAGAILNWADILVLPSHAEGMAMAVIEGLAHGLAVITTPVGAHEEAITDGVNGIFVKPGDIQSLSDALATLVTEPDRRQALSHGGRALFLSRFSMPVYMCRLDALYADICRKASARSPYQDPEHEPD
ncbi:glycosyltransferase family 4 protein (plasmid) [Paracoccus liaowanqingii]|uniref:Glycosyltransferase family 4 protein n=1 Tax=Paracoccus liaowanqingii TaxID=2560053 RepID=A0A4Y5SSM9_9RHOB|nr:glycosyltransferase family 4 protein [Paracoccus liaowanqingii]QDA35806.1 glycosyltransferase family 4 protein [Paracoccus liaowanqingii]